MRKREFLQGALMLLLVVLLIGCQVNPGNNGNPGSGNGNGSGQNGGSPGGDGQGSSGGGSSSKREPTIKLTALEIGETSISLEWSAVEGVEIYDVMLGGGGKRYSFYTDYSGANRSHTIENLVPGETYYIHVAEKIPSGSKIVNMSNSLTITTPSPSLPPLGEIRSKVTAHSIDLNWDAVAGADYYRVFWLDNDTWRFSYSTFNKPTFNHSGLEERVREYSYKVVAYSADGKRSSGFSKVITLTTDRVTLNLPTITMKVNSYRGEWSWPTPGPNEVMLYEYKFDKKKTVFWGPVELAAGETSFTLDGLAPGQEYFYRFRLINKITGEASSHSKLFTAAASQPELTTAPANLKRVALIQSGSGSSFYTAEFSWDALTGADYYYIYSDVITSGRFVFEGKTENTNYRLLLYNSDKKPVKIKVRAIYNSTKEGSAFSEPLTFDFQH